MSRYDAPTLRSMSGGGHSPVPPATVVPHAAIGQAPAWLQSLLQQPAFNGVTTTRATYQTVADTSASAGFDAAICVPAMNEAASIAACLAAVETSITQAAQNCLVVVVSNNSDDGTFLRACLSAAHMNAVVVDVTFCGKHAHAGRARRLALDIGAHFLHADGVLLSTDADSTVAPDWVSRALAALDGGAAMVCGALDVDAAELDAMPESVRQCGEAEAALTAALQSLWNRETKGTCGPFAIRTSGANFAMRLAPYRAIGGLPVLPFNEDRRTGELFYRNGFPIVDEPAMKVRTSCRLDARAENGMAACLNARAREDDPFVDNGLMPTRVLQRRARAAMELRKVLMSKATDTASLAHLSGLSELALRPLLGLPAAEAQAQLFEIAPALQAEPLRASQARKELQEAARLLNDGSDPAPLPAGPRT